MQQFDNDLAHRDQRIHQTPSRALTDPIVLTNQLAEAAALAGYTVADYSNPDSAMCTAARTGAWQLLTALGTIDDRPHPPGQMHGDVERFERRHPRLAAAIQSQDPFIGRRVWPVDASQIPEFAALRQALTPRALLHFDREWTRYATCGDHPDLWEAAIEVRDAGAALAPACERQAARQHLMQVLEDPTTYPLATTGSEVLCAAFTASELAVEAATLAELACRASALARLITEQLDAAGHTTIVAGEPDRDQAP